MSHADVFTVANRILKAYGCRYLRHWFTFLNVCTRDSNKIWPCDLYLGKAKQASGDWRVRGKKAEGFSPAFWQVPGELGTSICRQTETNPSGPCSAKCQRRWFERTFKSPGQREHHADQVTHYPRVKKFPGLVATVTSNIAVLQGVPCITGRRTTWSALTRSDAWRLGDTREYTLTHTRKKFMIPFEQ